MMMNNKTLIKEVDELKDVLSKGDAEIPSFWVCMWPGLCLVIWNIFCALISVRSEYYDVKYIFWVLISSKVLQGKVSNISFFFKKTSCLCFCIHDDNHGTGYL